MFESTKFRVLEIILKNRRSGFDAIQVALMRNLPALSWEEITSFIAVLGREGYLQNIYGDDALQAIIVQPAARARLYDARENVKSEMAKAIIDRIIKFMPLP